MLTFANEKNNTKINNYNDFITNIECYRTIKNAGHNYY